MKKVLYVATVDVHIRTFHLPYLKLLHDNGYEVHVATNGNEEFPYCDKKHQICIERSPFKISNIKAIRQLRKVINDGKFDIIHCHTPMGAVVTRLAAKKARKKHGTRVIYTTHGFHFYKGASKINWLLYYPIEKFLSKYTDILITINKEDFLIAKEKFKKTHVEYIPGVGVDDNKIKKTVESKSIRETRKKLGFNDNEFIIVYAARLDKNKNQLLLINSMEKLLKKRKNVHLLLAGSDELNGYYQNIVKEKKIEENIHFLGFRKDIYEIINASNLVVSASLREGLGINLIEALVLNKPIVATHNRGHNEIIKNGENGFFADTIEEFVEKIDYIIEYKPNFDNSNISAFLINNTIEKMAILYGLQCKKKEKVKGLISILMGTYNAKEFLTESIDSIINQTYKNWELIICDDGSTDGTLDILKKYEKKYPKQIHIIQNDMNKGLNYTLNHCMQLACGEYIARQDADDVSMYNRFEKEVDFLKKNHEYSFVSSNMIYFDENGEWGKSSQVEYPNKFNFIKGSPFCHAPVLIYRDAIEEVNYYTISNKLLRVEDYHLWFKLYSKGYKGANIREPLYKMRDDSNATKRRTWKNRVNEYYVRNIGFKMLGIPLKYNIYKFRPIIVGLLPKFLYNYLHKKNIHREILKNQNKTI